MASFPAKFLWGAATSAYQVEGNNRNSDWWAWEKKAGLQPSGEACRHYELFKEDFDLAVSLCHCAHRLSIEWGRIEPKEGEFSEKEIEHYKEVIFALRKRNLEPIVTLHHFTNPIWFADIGGWLNKKAPEYFVRYTEKIIEALGKDVRFWVTVNEPTVYVYYSYLYGTWPPQEKSIFKTKSVMDALANAHIKAYKVIRDYYKKNNLTTPMISVASNMQAYEYCRPTLKNRMAVYLRHRLFNLDFINKLIRHKSLDFIGLNYYSRSLVDTRSFWIRNLYSDNCKDNCLPLMKNSMGWDIYPEGLYKLLLSLKRYRLPLFILENGICTDDDGLRWDFIREHLKMISLAIEKGVDVIGYLYWSLLDNFEWDKGFTPRFGLIEVDYKDYQRKVRESGKRFSLVCKTGELAR